MEKEITAPFWIRGVPMAEDGGMILGTAILFEYLKALQTWQASFLAYGEGFRRVSFKLTRLNYTLAGLLVVDAIQIVNQVLELGLEVKVRSIV